MDSNSITEKDLMQALQQLDSDLKIIRCIRCHKDTLATLKTIEVSEENAMEKFFNGIEIKIDNRIRKGVFKVKYIKKYKPVRWTAEKLFFFEQWREGRSSSILNQIY